VQQHCHHPKSQSLLFEGCCLPSHRTTRSPGPTQWELGSSVTGAFTSAACILLPHDPTLTCILLPHAPYCHMHPTATCILLPHDPTLTCILLPHAPYCHMHPTATCILLPHDPTLTCIPLPHAPYCHMPRSAWSSMSRSSMTKNHSTAALLINRGLPRRRAASAPTMLRADCHTCAVRFAAFKW